MTKKYAKKLCLEVWEYLRDHPETRGKWQLPKKLYAKIKWMDGYCPLCEMCKRCRGCPLEHCIKDDSLYYQWHRARTDKTRAKYASAIVEKVKAWKV